MDSWKIVLFRCIIVWVVLHIVLFFIELYRYKHSVWSWEGFKQEGMLFITYFVWAIDGIGCWLTIVGWMLYFIFEPVINK